MRNTPIDELEKRLHNALKRLSYVQSIQINTFGDDSLSGDAILTKFYFVDFYYNKRLFKLNFALIYRESQNNGKRVWALDRDNRIGWHLHPLNQVEIHEPIEEKSIEEIVEMLDQVWQKINQK